MSSPPHRRLALLHDHLLAASPVSASEDGVQRHVPVDVVDKAFANFHAAGVAPGIAYGVVVNGKLVHTGGVGTLRATEESPPRADTIFRIASMSKSFVAAAVLLLRDEGVLRLDDTVEQWVPELKGSSLASLDDSRAPTLRQLLSMSSGYPEDDPWADRLESMSDDEYTALIGEPKTFSRAPGSAFEYSNFGYTLIGRVIQNATGRPFRDVVSERIIEPLGLKDTRWSEDGMDPSRLAIGYARVDGKWVAQPIQAPGAFSALGGLYSTVADIATWIIGFMDAWLPSAAQNYHPLSRASRREMQQPVTVMPLQLGGGEGLLRAQVQSYCMGLMSTETLTLGRTIGHPGGYPGFGSYMTWHPASRTGVIALANGRYAVPFAPVLKVLAALMMGSPRTIPNKPVPAVDSIRASINSALVASNFASLEPLLAGNVGLDVDLHQLAAQVAGLARKHGPLRPEDHVFTMAPMQVQWWLSGESGRVGVTIMLNPERPPKVQKLSIVSVLPPTADLEKAVEAALDGLKRNSELSHLVLPIRRKSWVACDGSNSGTLLLEGSLVDFQLHLDLKKDRATFVPDRRWTAPPV